MAEEDDFIPDVPVPKPVGAVASLGHGLQSGLTLGLQPKLEAAITAGLGKIAGEGNFSDIYQKEVAKTQAAAKAAQEAHPFVYGAGQLVGSAPAFAATAPGPAAGVGKWALQGGALGAAQGIGESEHLAGAQGTDLGQAAVDVALGGLGGAAGGAAGYGIGKGATYGLGKWADRKAMDAVGATTVGAREELKGLLKTIGVTEPGQFAQMVRKSGVAGGFHGLGSVRAAAEASKSGGIDAFKDLIQKATASGKTMEVNDLIQHLDKEAGNFLLGVGATPGAQDLSQKMVADLATQGIANRTGQPFEVVAKAIADQPELLSQAKGNLTFTHEQFQDALKRLSKQSSTWRNKLARGTITEDELGRLHVYDALRAFQDKGLEAAVGESGRPARQAIALNSVIEKTAGHRQTALEGQKMVGLQSALWGGTIGGTLSALGLPHVGLPVMAAGLLEKSTAPLRANVLTSALSKAQYVPKLIGKYGGRLPMALGRQVGTDVGLAFSPQGAPEDEDFIPDKTDTVAKKGK